jgi:UTP-glucose-1-phosphate uridylyltransferase
MTDTKLNATLVVLAGGLGSRYKGLKQTDGMGLNNESLMEYSIYDAIRAGFNSIVFIVNNQFSESLKSLLIKKISCYKSIKIQFVLQELSAYIPTEFLSKVKNRTKPWGTGHALLMAKSVVKEPFAVINADDYYGQDSFGKMYEILTAVSVNFYSMMGYPIQNTLSENGFVSRGICELNSENLLQSIVEQTKIKIIKNKILATTENNSILIEENTLVSMNFWGFHPSIFNHLENYFNDFLLSKTDLSEVEFFLPSAVNNLVQQKKCKVKVLASTDCWFGITYPEDKRVVQEKIKTLVNQNKYPAQLWPNQL